MATRTWSSGSSRKRPPRAILLIVHGGGWHSGYFDALSCKLAAEIDIFIAAFDQPGCGYSDPEPSAPRGYTHIRSIDDCIDDIFEAAWWAQNQARNGNKAPLPLFLLGESYGGVQVLIAALEARKGYGFTQLVGAIVLGGLIRVVPDMLPPAPVVALLKYLARYYPRVAMPATDTSKTFDEAFGNKAWAKVARMDPKVSVSVKPTLGMAAAILSAGDSLLERASDFPVPLLAIHGARDCRTQCEVMQEFVDKIGSNAKMVIIDTDGHQLLQDEPTKSEMVIDTISQWLSEQIKVSCL